MKSWQQPIKTATQLTLLSACISLTACIDQDDIDEALDSLSNEEPEQSEVSEPQQRVDQVRPPQNEQAETVQPPVPDSLFTANEFNQNVVFPRTADLSILANAAEDVEVYAGLLTRRIDYPVWQFNQLQMQPQQTSEGDEIIWTYDTDEDDYQLRYTAIEHTADNRHYWRLMVREQGVAEFELREEIWQSADQLHSEIRFYNLDSFYEITENELTDDDPQIHSHSWISPQRFKVQNYVLSKPGYHYVIEQTGENEGYWISSDFLGLKIGNRDLPLNASHWNSDTLSHWQNCGFDIDAVETDGFTDSCASVTAVARGADNDEEEHFNPLAYRPETQANN